MTDTGQRSKYMMRDSRGIDSDSVPLTAARPISATKEWTTNSEAQFEEVIRTCLHSANEIETDLNNLCHRHLVVKSGRMTAATQMKVVESSPLATIECPPETKEIDTILTLNRRLCPSISRQVVVMTVFLPKLVSIIVTTRHLREPIAACHLIDEYRLREVIDECHLRETNDDYHLREMIDAYRLQETIGGHHLRETIDDFHLHLEVKLLLLIFIII